MKTLIVDNYDSFTFNLYQMVAAISGELPVVVHNDGMTWAQFLDFNPDSVIISPGPGRPDNDRDFGICRQIILESRVPILGVCLGFQGIAQLFGGTIDRAPEPMHGRSSRIFHDGLGLMAGIPQGFSAVRYHSLSARQPIPAVLRTTAWTSDELPMALEHFNRPLWGVQFHPESIATEHGAQLLGNFRRMAMQNRGERGSSTSQPITISNPTPAATDPWQVFSRRLDSYPSTEAAFSSLFGDATPAFWLDSAESSRARFSFMGSAEGPEALWVSYSTKDANGNHHLELHSANREEVRNESLFDFVQAELQRRRCSSPDLPFDFNGGFVGYFGYELKAECGGQTAHQSPHPDACLIFADRMIAFDHKEQSVYLVFASPREVPHDFSTASAAASWFDEMQRRIETEVQPPAPATAQAVDMEFHPEQTHAQYLDSIQKCMEWIRDGESYEICLTNQMHADTPVCPIQYYRGLRRSNPAPNSAFLRFPKVSVACSSPERFLKIDPQGTVEKTPAWPLQCCEQSTPHFTDCEPRPCPCNRP